MGGPAMASTVVPSGETARPVGKDCSVVIVPAGAAGRPSGSHTCSPKGLVVAELVRVTLSRASATNVPRSVFAR